MTWQRALVTGLTAVAIWLTLTALDAAESTKRTFAYLVVGWSFASVIEGELRSIHNRLYDLEQRLNPKLDDDD